MQLKEKKFHAESITEDRYTSFLFFPFLSRQEQSSPDKKSIVPIDPPSKNAYRKIFLRFEIAGNKNLLQVVEPQGEKWGDAYELAVDVRIWLTPDPAGQFFNPYAYGGDPVNFVDPNGEVVFLAAVLTYAAYTAIVAAAAYGAYRGGERAYNESEGNLFATQAVLCQVLLPALPVQQQGHMLLPKPEDVLSAGMQQDHL